MQAAYLAGNRLYNHAAFLAFPCLSGACLGLALNHCSLQGIGAIIGHLQGVKMGQLVFYQ